MSIIGTITGGKLRHTHGLILYRSRHYCQLIMYGVHPKIFRPVRFSAQTYFSPSTIFRPVPVPVLFSAQYDFPPSTGTTFRPVPTVLFPPSTIFRPVPVLFSAQYRYGTIFRPVPVLFSAQYRYYFPPSTMYFPPSTYYFRPVPTISAQFYFPPSTYYCRPVLFSAAKVASF